MQGQRMESGGGLAAIAFNFLAKQTPGASRVLGFCLFKGSLVRTGQG